MNFVKYGVVFSLMVISTAFAQIDTVGFTWYDMQCNGGGNRSIAIDPSATIHVVWTNGVNSGASMRHVYYNVYTAATGWTYDTLGVPVEMSLRGGYADLTVNSSGYPFVAFHEIMPSSLNAHAAVATDLFPGCGAFQYWECPYIYEGGSDLEVIWPKIAVGLNDWFHVIYTENPSIPADSTRMYYCRGQFDPMTFDMQFTDQTRVDWVKVIGADIAASRLSNRIAFIYANPFYVYGDYYGNDIYLQISEAGINWDFTNPIDITGFIPPDSVGQNGDTLFAIADFSIFFDDLDLIHVAFTTIGRSTTNPSNSMIWHWSEDTGYYSLVADGWYDGIQYTCPDWEYFVQNPCLAIDETTSDLFITYQQFDTTDAPPNGLARSEVLISRSTSDGVRWSEGTNVTNTNWQRDDVFHSWCERNPTCNETVENNALHLSYIADLIPGSVVHEYNWSRNPVIYHKVHIDSIPATPLMPIYPLHIDSTGMPPLYFPDHTTITSGIIAQEFHLHQNYPNPFNAITNIQFDIPTASRVHISVYNILGKHITTLIDKHLNQGFHTIPFDASDLSSGIYFIKIQTNQFQGVRKAVLMK